MLCSGRWCMWDRPKTNNLIRSWKNSKSLQLKRNQPWSSPWTARPLTTPKSHLISWSVLHFLSLGVTALIITVSYRSQEFIRVGYYVHNALAPDATHLNRDNASIHKLISHTKRTILFDKPRITKFKIDWTSKLDTHPSQSSHSHPQHINNQHIKN